MAKRTPKVVDRTKPGLIALLNHTVVLTEYWAQEAVKRYPTWGLVSIRNYEQEELPVFGSGPRITLNFDDILIVSPRILRIYRPPLPGDVALLMEFAEYLRREPPPGLIIHCGSGISRGPAAAIGIFRTILGEHHEVPAIKHMQDAVERSITLGMRHHKQLAPNMRVIGLLDHQLTCRGKLVTEVLRSYYQHAPLTVAQILEDTKE